MNERKVFVDLGPGQVDITKYIKSNDLVHIYITHHDADHLNGLKYFANKMSRVKEITVPFYQNEITLISKAILSLKGMSRAKECGEFIRLLEDIVANQVFLGSLIRKRSEEIRLSFAWEGHYLTDAGFECLNPPRFIKTFNWLREMPIRELEVTLGDIFEPEFAETVGMYFNEMSGQRYSVRRAYEGTFLHELLLEESEKSDGYLQEMVSDINLHKASFIVDFILRNMELFRDFNADPRRETLRDIYADFVKCTHDACLVLKVKREDKTFLLAGDASKKVFRRLIAEDKDISADYLKMPHHGSKRNITEEIMAKIHPGMVIISHNNRSFGKAKDPLPNMKVLEMLERAKIEVALTNDVRKQGMVCMRKEKHSGDEYIEVLG